MSKIMGYERLDDSEEDAYYERQLWLRAKHLRGAVDEDILRCVSSRIVCSGGGQYLLDKGFQYMDQSSKESGQAQAQAQVAKSSEDTYALSTPTRDFDAFLSHSWRDSGRLKYLALCYHFNLHAALAVGYLAATLAFLYCLAFGDPWPLSISPSLCPDDPARHYGTFVSLVGYAAYNIVFFFGHNFVWLVAPSRMFLDKICIHQTDPDKKYRGICALEHFLHHSHSLICCYMSDYFERLWCVYEIAAYTRFDLKRDASNIVFMPLLKAPTVLWLQLSFWLWRLVEYAAGIELEGLFAEGGADVYGFVHINDWGKKFGLPMMAVAFGVSGVLLCEAAKQRSMLTEQMSNFSVANAKVFSESDRDVVNKSIEEWFADEEDGGNGTAAPPARGREAQPDLPPSHSSPGIARFEAEVRHGKVHEAVARRLAGASGLTYTDLLAGFFGYSMLNFECFLHNSPASSFGLTSVAMQVAFFPLTIVVIASLTHRTSVLFRCACLPPPLEAALIFLESAVVGIAISLFFTLTLLVNPQCALFGTLL
jgi:hypothetical protein